MSSNWIHTIGLDLTDPFSRARRPIAAAEMRHGKPGSPPRICILDPIPWPDFEGRCTPEVARTIVERAGIAGSSEALLVIDGPQALARRGESVRECERAAATPGRTPDQEPTGRKPFAGYIRASVQLFDALLQDERWRLLESRRDRSATLLEAFPGDAWRLSAERLAAKATVVGRRQRLELLQQHVDLEGPELPTHDDLDAAMCAALGYWWMEGRTQVLGEPPTFDDGWREGYIIVPRLPSERRTAREAAPPVAVPRRTRDERAPSTWGYRATGAIANRKGTFELAAEHGVLVRTAFNVNHHAIANVKAIRPGDRILLVHSHGGRRDWLQAIVDQPSPKIPPIRGHEAELPALGVIQEPDLAAYVEALGYPRDPYLGVFTALPLTDVEHCDHPPENVAAGQNAIWRIA